MAEVSYVKASRVFSGNPPVRAVDELSLDVTDGEFLVLVGPSGSGKSTALRMLAGLEDVDEGAIHIGGKDVTNVPPKGRDIAMVFQSYALYPHMTVAENMGFALRLAGVPKAERAKRVRDAAVILDLTDLLDRKPRALSGGQRQRVAMGRAIVRQPQVFCMDEPLSNLDAKLRVATRTQIAALQQRLGVTTVYVTHDQVEAMTMGDRVAVMRKGELQQVAPPQELYDRPDNLFVAGFIGSPAMNMIEATLEQSNGGLAAALGGSKINLGDETLSARPALRSYAGRSVILGIRPEDIEDAELEPDTPADRRMRGQVVLKEALGSEIMVHFSTDATQAVTDETRELQKDVGAPETPTAVMSSSGATLVGRFGARSKVSEGKPVEVAVDTRALHFFDPETGLGIYDADTTKGAGS